MEHSTGHPAENTTTGLTTLIPLSGGIDSTYALVKYLRETDDAIVCLHVCMANREQRWQAEELAVGHILTFLKEQDRPFQYERSVLDRRQISNFGLDVISVTLHVGAACRGLLERKGVRVSRWFFGMCRDEERERESDPDQSNRMEHIFTCSGIVSGASARHAR